MYQEGCNGLGTPKTTWMATMSSDEHPSPPNAVGDIAWLLLILRNLLASTSVHDVNLTIGGLVCLVFLAKRA